VRITFVLAAVERARGVGGTKDGLLRAVLAPALSALQLQHAWRTVLAAAARCPEPIRAAVPARRCGAVAKLAQLANEVDVVRRLVLCAGGAAARLLHAVARMTAAARL